MFKKFIINSLAITGFAMVVRDALTVTAVKCSSKSETARAYLTGTLIRTYADIDLIESGMSEEEIEYAKNVYRISKEMK